VSSVRETEVGVTTTVASGSDVESPEFAASPSSVAEVHAATTAIKAIDANAILSSFEIRESVKVMVMSASNRPNSVLPAYQATTPIARGYSTTQ
jgi:hypothetical protein